MQKLGASSAIHGSFKSFKAVDLPFRLAIAPTFRDRISDGVNIPAQGAGEPLHRVESGLLCVLQPSGKLASVFASENATKPHHEPPHDGEFRPFAFQRVNRCRLSARQRSAWLDAQRRGDDGRNRSPCRRID